MMLRLAKYFITFLTVACALQAADSVSACQTAGNSLANVKRVFVESFPSTPRVSQVASVTRELAKYGFEVVEDPSHADAILTGEAQAEIVLHGDGSVPDKSIFTYRLSLPDKTVIWKHRVKLVSKSSLADDYDYAARKIAERLNGSIPLTDSDGAKRADARIVLSNSDAVTGSRHGHTRDMNIFVNGRKISILTWDGTDGRRVDVQETIRTKPGNNRRVAYIPAPPNKSLQLTAR